MKRMITSTSGFYVGEPNEWGKDTKGKSHSYYDNPPDWEDKQYYTIAFVQDVYRNNEGMDQLFWPNVGQTPWVVLVQSKVNRSDYFKFDLWDDEEGLDLQKDDFLEWVEKQQDDLDRKSST